MAGWEVRLNGSAHRLRDFTTEGAEDTEAAFRGGEAQSVTAASVHRDSRPAVRHRNVPLMMSTSVPSVLSVVNPPFGT
jgi:hypothetical protein